MLLDYNLEGQFDQSMAQEAVLVMFTQRGCPFCQSTKPVVRQWAAAHPGVAAYTLDCDRFPGLASRARIRSLPTLIVYRRGRPAGRWTGAADTRQVDRLVNRALEG